jgi:hypothetical protein
MAEKYRKNTYMIGYKYGKKIIVLYLSLISRKTFVNELWMQIKTSIACK